MSSIYLKKLSVGNFRNLNPFSIDFSSKINCIFGLNGNGKTNILEAIYYLTNKKSFRKNTGFPQILSLDGDISEIYFSSVLSDEKNKNLSYSGKVRHEGSTWYLNGRPYSKRIELKSIFISPFDSHHFHLTSKFRRDWFDHHIAILYPEYKKAHSKFSTALRMRNQLLSKRPSHYQAQIKAIDEGLGQYIFEICLFRQKAIDQINQYFGDIFKELFSESHQLEIYFQSEWKNLNLEEIQIKLRRRESFDLAAGRTLAGPQRDDFIPYFDGLSGPEFCSLGQQKMSYLSLIFAYIELFRYKFNSYPILLVDDVSGELDKGRWRNLINYIKGKTFQTFITTANEDFRMELEVNIDLNRLDVFDGTVQSSLTQKNNSKASFPYL